MIGLRYANGRLYGRFDPYANSNLTPGRRFDLRQPCPCKCLGTARKPAYRSLRISEVPTIIETIPANAQRQERCREIMAWTGAQNWWFHYCKTESPYWINLNRAHRDMLRRHNPPLLICECDIEPRDYQDVIQFPETTQIVYLGGGRTGHQGAVVDAQHRFPDLGIKKANRIGYGYVDVDADWMRVFGSFYATAILYIDKQVMLDVANDLENETGSIDSIFAVNQWRRNVLLRRTPMFWQNDSVVHKYDTYEYAPDGLPWRESAPVPWRANHLRAERRRILAK